MITIRDESGNEVPLYSKIWSSKNIGGLSISIDERSLSINLENHDFEVELKSGEGKVNGVKFSITSSPQTLIATLSCEEELLEIRISKLKLKLGGNDD